MDLVSRFSRLARRRLGLHLSRVMARPFGAARSTCAAAEDFQYRGLGEEEMLAWCADAELELDPAQVRAAFARGDACLGALEGGRLVAYLFLAFGATPHTGGVWVEFHPQARYSYKKFVRPSHRGRRVAHGLGALADSPEFVRERAFATSFIDLENRASLAATARSGSRTVGYAGYLRIGRRVLAFRTPGARRHGFRFCAAPQRIVAVSPPSTTSSAPVAYFDSSLAK